MRKQTWLEGYMWPCTHVCKIVKPSAVSTNTSISGWTIGQRRELPSKRCLYASSKNAENMSHASFLQGQLLSPLETYFKMGILVVVSHGGSCTVRSLHLSLLWMVCVKPCLRDRDCIDSTLSSSATGSRDMNRCSNDVHGESTCNELQSRHHATQNIMIQSESYQKFITVLQLHPTYL